MVNSRLITEFVNTRDLKPPAEHLDSPGALVAWLAERDLVAAGTRATRADVAAAQRLREALRELAAGDESALEEVDRAARAAKLSVRFGDGAARMQPEQPGVRGALGQIVAEVAAALSDGTWTRIKVCEADDCCWAFHDTSKNRSRHWCSMQSCGNRAKVRAFRARQG